MDLQKLKEGLMAKGISVVASSNEITAGLAWSVEGIEKVPKLGELLFYKVNGVEYGVKPSKGNKHDIHWYYDQLKTGMKGARGYSAGLTQFLNVWVKKKELVIVYKGGKVAESAVCAVAELKERNQHFHNPTAESKLVENIAKQLGLKEIFFSEWEGDYKGYKLYLMLDWPNEESNNEEDKKFRIFCELKDVNNHQIGTLDINNNIMGTTKTGIENELNKLLPKKVTASPQLISETAIDNIILTEMSLNASKKQNADEDVEWIIRRGDNAEFVVKYQDGVASISTGYGSVLYNDIKTAIEFIKKMGDAMQARLGKQVTAASPRKYRPSIRERMDRDTYLDPMDFDITERKDVEAFNKFKKEVQSIELFGRRPFNAFAYLGDKPEDLKKAKTGSHKYIEDINLEFRNGYIQVKCSEIEMDRLDGVLSSLNGKYKFKVLDYVGNGKFEFSASFGGNQTLYVLKPDELNYTIKNLRTECRLIEKVTSPFYIEQITADVPEVKETLGEVNEENFKGINKEHDRLLYIKVTPEQFLQLWKTSPNFNGSQLQKIVYGFKLALRTLNSKFENKGILIECFYKKKDGKGYIRVEYDKELYIIYVSRAEDNGDIKVITRKMRKMIPTRNFNILSTSVGSLAFERANMPSGFKPIWEEVTQSKT